MKRILFFFAVLVLSVTFSSCNKCKDVSCQNEGICEDGLCECATGFSGEFCEIEDKCVTGNVQCENEGICEDGICDCEPRFFGERCETYCLKGSYKKSDGSCNCYPGYDGESCTNEMRLAWIATYSLNSTCNTLDGESVISAKDHPDPDSVNIATNYVSVTNLTSAGDTKGYGIIVDGNKLRIPVQNVKDANGTTFKVFTDEDAELNGSNFTMVVKRQYQQNQPTPCLLTYTRQ